MTYIYVILNHDHQPIMATKTEAAMKLYLKKNPNCTYKLVPFESNHESLKAKIRHITHKTKQKFNDLMTKPSPIDPVPDNINVDIDDLVDEFPDPSDAELHKHVDNLMPGFINALHEKYRKHHQFDIQEYQRYEQLFDDKLESVYNHLENEIDDENSQEYHVYDALKQNLLFEWTIFTAHYIHNEIIK